MQCYIGVDLGSTTTKAIYMDLEENILGRGITNSRSNYELACKIAIDQGGINTRLNSLLFGLSYLCLGGLDGLLSGINGIRARQLNACPLGRNNDRPCWAGL